MKTFSKRVIRKILGILTRWTLRKHRPTVIFVVGEGETSIVRESIYYALRESLPTRRNLELPEAEFSIPITILNYPNYPKNLLGWMWLVIKTLVQLITIRPYNHNLVLEVHPLDAGVWYYWKNIIRPDLVVKVGNFEYGVAAGFMEMSNSEDVLDSAKDLAMEVAERLGIDGIDAELGLSQLDLPEPRLQILNGKNGSTIVDATYYYFPIRLQAIADIVPSLGEEVFIINPSTDDLDFIGEQNLNWQIQSSNKDLGQKSGQVIILRGSRTRFDESYRELLIKPNQQ